MKDGIRIENTRKPTVVREHSIQCTCSLLWCSSTTTSLPMLPTSLANPLWFSNSYKIHAWVNRATPANIEILKDIRSIFYPVRPRYFPDFHAHFHFSKLSFRCSNYQRPFFVTSQLFTSFNSCSSAEDTVLAFGFSWKDLPAKSMYLENIEYSTT